MIQHGQKMPSWSDEERDGFSSQIGIVSFYYSVFCMSVCICISACICMYLYICMYLCICMNLYIYHVKEGFSKDQIKLHSSLEGMTALSRSTHWFTEKVALKECRISELGTPAREKHWAIKWAKTQEKCSTIHGLHYRLSANISWSSLSIK